MNETTHTGHTPTPDEFTERLPRYVYRDGAGRASVQWRQAALEMCGERDQLLADVRKLREALDMVSAADRLCPIEWNAAMRKVDAALAATGKWEEA